MARVWIGREGGVSPFCTRTHDCSFEEKPFKLPENILCEIKNNENLVTLVTDSSEQKNLDSENLNLTIEIEYGEITVPLNENLLTLQHDTANETDIAEINYNDNKTAGSGDELFQLDDTAECFDENLREEKDSESDFDLNDNHKEERKRKLEYSRKLSQTKRLRGEQYIGYSRSSDGKVTQNKNRQERSLKCRCLHGAPKK
ncbi:hypothetical protein CBL_10516 [Carabus blaptoides fortunei]